MATPKIGIVVSTTRPGRFADKPTEWILGVASKRGDMNFEIVDLRDYPMPFFEETRAPIYTPALNEHARRWSARVDTLDGFIFVTAEYNRGPSGVLKNALDHAYREFNKKPAAFVGYGGLGGARAIEQLRLICIELQMAPIRTGVHLAGEDFMASLLRGKPITEFAYLEQSAAAMLDELCWWTMALKAARDRDASAAKSHHAQAS